MILDKPGRPFRCLDAQYRRELVRVYLTNVESICRRFCDERRGRLAWLKAEAGPFREWWESLAPERQRRLLTERGEVVLKGVVKQFFNEKEVTSTLVMDALYAGCRQLEEASRAWAAVSGWLGARGGGRGRLHPARLQLGTSQRLQLTRPAFYLHNHPTRSADANPPLPAPSSQGAAPEGSPAPSVLIRAERNTFTFGAGALDVAERAACPDWIPAYREDKGVLGADGLALRSGGPESGPEGEARRDSVDRDERRLGELGRKTVEMLAIAHIFCDKLEVRRGFVCLCVCVSAWGEVVCVAVTAWFSDDQPAHSLL